MVLACHIALTNSVYLQEHQATLCTCCQLVRFCTKISAAGHPKHERSPSCAGSRRLGAGPVHRTRYWFPNTNVKYGFSEIGEQGYIETSWHGACFSCTARSITTPRLKREKRKRERAADKWEAHEAKTCCDRTSVVWCKMLKTVYKYATLTVKHIVELSFICEPHKSWSNVNSSTALHTVSSFVS